MHATRPDRRPRTSGRLGASVVAVTLALMAAACGGDDDAEQGQSSPSTTAATGATTGPSSAPSGPTTEAPPDDVDSEGVLRIGLDLTATGGLDLDPIEMDSPVDFHVHYNIYDTLLRQHEDGSYEPGLAASATITNPSTIEIELRDGVTFQDGTDFDAEAVKFSIERNIAANKLAPFRMAELGQIASITVQDPLHLTINLSSPTAGSFYNLLAHNETLVVSPTAVRNGVNLNENPVGAGPFKVASYARESRLVLEKWDGYFQADQIKLAGIEYVQTTVASVVQALRSDAIDVASLPPDLLRQLEGSGLELRNEPSPNAISFVNLRCDTVEAFQDVRVRQALNYATDKEAMNQVLFAGLGEPMSQVWPSWSPYYNADLAHVYDRDLDKAKDLLAQAGHPSLSLSMAVLPGASQRAGELLQQQWAEAGVTVTLIPATNFVQEFLLDKKMDTSPVAAQSRLWTDKVTRNFAPGSTGYTCPAEDQAFKDKLLELRGYAPDDPAAVNAWKELSTLLSEQALTVFMANGTVANAWNSDVLGNPTWNPNQLGTLWPDVHRVYVKQ